MKISDHKLKDYLYESYQVYVNVTLRRMLQTVSSRPPFEIQITLADSLCLHRSDKFPMFYFCVRRTGVKYSCLKGWKWCSYLLWYECYRASLYSAFIRLALIKFLSLVRNSAMNTSWHRRRLPRAEILLPTQRVNNFSVEENRKIIFGREITTLSKHYFKRLQILSKVTPCLMFPNFS